MAGLQNPRFRIGQLGGSSALGGPQVPLGELPEADLSSYMPGVEQEMFGMGPEPTWDSPTSLQRGGAKPPRVPLGAPQTQLAEFGPEEGMELELPQAQFADFSEEPMEIEAAGPVSMPPTEIQARRPIQLPEMAISGRPQTAPKVPLGPQEPMGPPEYNQFGMSSRFATEALPTMDKLRAAQLGVEDEDMAMEERMQQALQKLQPMRKPLVPLGGR